ncbi:MAG: hypothetical protein KAT49_04685 [Methanomicrobia archaeon]|nr:hypothetical protein [Methanomicrobia archaeon]MCK4637156.1 hypothetical protein [Methanomicrobia archaeon]
MEEFFGEWVHIASYLTLGTLFFCIVWSLVEEITSSMFNENIGKLLGIVVGTYGFWYPLMPPLKIFYILLLSFVALVGTALSRMSLILKWATHKKRTVSIIAFTLVLFEIIKLFIMKVVQTNSLHILVVVLSWLLLTWGIVGGVWPNLIKPVVASMHLPHSRFIQAAFILALVIFLPIEFSFIDSFISIATICGVLWGAYYF